jgi:glycoside/pentoside/hexuronide:cation symporter, GPH family
MNNFSNIRLFAILAYAAPAFPLAFLALPFIVLVPEFYATQQGIPLALVGSAFLVIRLCDALADPLTGWLCDRFRPRFGRRRTWLLATFLPCCAATWIVFVPPEGAGWLYLVLAGCALSLTWTAFQIPYLALGAELSRSPSGRTRIVAWREGLTVAGTMAALTLPVLAPSLEPFFLEVFSGFSRESGGLLLAALVVSILLPLTLLFTLITVPEPVERTRKRVSFREGWQILLANRPFWILLGGFFLNGLANGLPASLFLMYVAEILHLPERAGPLLLLYFICAILGLPLWLWLARRFSKPFAWRAGMILACIGFVGALFLGSGDLGLFAVICIVTGIALGADIVMPLSIQADILDLDTLASGEERSGLYLALWAFSAKLALGLAAGIAFPLLAASGFDPSQNLRLPEGLTMLAFLYAGLPILLKLAALALLYRLNLSNAAAEKTSQSLEKINF